MALESATYIYELNSSNPTAGDPVSQADDHLRLIKAALRNTPLVIARSYTEYTANANLTTVLPGDDTIPQNTEGTEIISVSFTPKSTTNRLRLRFTGYFSLSIIASGSVALFSSASANALRAAEATAAAANYLVPITLEHEYVPGTTSALTFSVRAGPDVAATMRFNGTSAARRFGGTSAATLVIEEIQV